MLVSGCYRRYPQPIFSTRKWIAYWAVGEYIIPDTVEVILNVALGWNLTAVHYRNRVHMILAQMYALIAKVQPRNQHQVQTYVEIVSSSVFPITMSLQRVADLDPFWRSKFRDYEEFEVNRLHDNLTQVDYRINSSDTLRAIAGQGRIEKVCLYRYSYGRKTTTQTIVSVPVTILVTTTILGSHQSLSKSCPSRRCIEWSFGKYPLRS